MNKKITAAIDAVKNNPTEENKKELADLAVPKFKDIYARVQKAVRTINRHIGVNKGTPNRSTMATAIGLTDDVIECNQIGILLGMNEICDAANLAIANVAKIADQRKTGKYEHIDVMPDFYTAEELRTINADDDKFYLYNVTNAAIAAIDTINRHVDDLTCDPNTFKIAKVVGYADTIVALKNRLANDINYGLATDADMKAAANLGIAIANILTAKANGYTTAIDPLDYYNPFPDADDGELCDGEEGETACDGAAE